MQNLTTPTAQAPVAAPSPEEVNTSLHAEAALEGAPCIEHMSVLSFLRRVPNDQPLGLHNMMKYGNLVGNMARAFHLPYHATLEPELGVVQAFPEPLMMRAYRYLSPALGWPTIIDVKTLRPAQKIPPERQVMTPAAELQVRRTIAVHLRSWAEQALESEIRCACRVILAVLEQECAALERQIGRDQQSR